MKISNNVYDVLKWIAMYLLPGAGTLYFALAQIWGLPYGEEVVGSLTAIDTFLAMMLGLSTRQYMKSDDFGDGTFQVNSGDPEKDIYRLNLTTPIDELPRKKVITFRVDTDAKR